MDFKLDLVGRRERRAIALTAAALLALAVTSIAYLRPATSTASPVISKAPASQIGTTYLLPVRVGTGHPENGYITWDRDPPQALGGH